MMWAGVSVMVTDEAFVASKMAQLNSESAGSALFRGRLDLSRIGAIGHSMGGQAATRACLEYTAFKACACLDGLNFFFYLRPAASAKPFLLLLNSTWGARFVTPSLAKRYLAAWATPQVFVVPGTKHNSFSDIPILSPVSRAKAPSDPVKAQRLITAAVVNFFNQAFAIRGSVRTNDVENNGLMPVDLKTIANQKSASHAAR
jgi:dienelactone hydrolase